MAFNEATEQVRKQGFALRSIQRPDARVSLLYQHGDVEVIAVEVGPGVTLAEASLWGKSSWHLVVEGEAIFQQGERKWELLPGESLSLRDSTPYALVNPTPGRLKLLTLLFKPGETNLPRGGDGR